MKKALPLAFMLLASMYMSAQCGIVSIIGEHTGWSEDLIMTNNLDDLNKYTFELGLVASDDSDTSGFVEMKFRQALGWDVNWGASDFPTGTAALNGDNILVPVGSYLVEFDCSTLTYTFTQQCGQISLIGEFVDWADDYNLTRDADNPDVWTGFLGLLPSNDTNEDNLIELKFRQNADWDVNWGSADFPTGTGLIGGDNIPAVAGSYNVTFNCSSGAYSFESTTGALSLIGEFTGWADDIEMKRDGDNWSAILTVDESDDLDENGTIEGKFRVNKDWGLNYGVAEGTTDSLCGPAAENAGNISLPFGSYAVTFNDQTLEYCFTPTCGQVSMIGAFIGWSADVNMVRSDDDPNMWTATRSFYADTEMKFRENNAWDVNWGATDFPSGTATVGGGNIPLTAGEYDVTFNCSTLEYTFTPSTSLPCGEIGIIGDFNAFGAPEVAGDPATDVWMVRNPEMPSDFSLFYNFDATTNFYFREDADAAFMNIWGGTAFPIGQGVQDAATQLSVPGGKYNINFNCISGQYEFERLGNSVVAPKVFAISVDGETNEADWKIDKGILNVIDGTPGDSTTDASFFGVTYTDEFLYIGVNVTDESVETAGEPAVNDHVVIYVDGDKSGGAYTESDVAFFVDAAGTVGTVAGAEGAEGAASITETGYSVEGRVAWADLGITVADIAGIGFDVIVQDADGADTVRYAWNGNAMNNESTSAFGDLSLGSLDCGNISLYSAGIGDIGLSTLTAVTTEYVATFELASDASVVFRKDNSDVVSWGGDAFPSGIAAIGGAAIDATAGRYMVSFDCLSEAYTFTEAPAGDCVILSDITDTAPVIDGDLSEFTLDNSAELLVDGASPNNTATFGTTWDQTNLYVGVKVVDAAVLSSGAVNPWEQDAIEFYIDGNHDADGAYDTDRDVQLIVYDNDGVSTVWDNGGPAADVVGSFTVTGDGYTVELQVPWANLGFSPGPGRTIGFSLGVNDADDAAGTRNSQMVWCGESTNFNNTSAFGDIQLRGGSVGTKDFLFNDEILVYPNPATNFVTIQTKGDKFDEATTLRLFDQLGRTIKTSNVNLRYSSVTMDVTNIPTGIFYLEVAASNGNKAIKKVIIE